MRTKVKMNIKIKKMGVLKNEKSSSNYHAYAFRGDRFRRLQQ